MDGWTYANASEAETIEKLDELVARGFLPHYQLSTVDSEGVRSYRAKAYVDGLVNITEPQPESLFAMLSLSKPFTNLLALKNGRFGAYSNWTILSRCTYPSWPRQVNPDTSVQNSTFEPKNNSLEIYCSIQRGLRRILN